MNRRDFLLTSTVAILSTLLSKRRGPRAAPIDLDAGPAPRPQLTAAVDVIVPADPDIPGDFKGSDYGADRVLAASLGDAGQAVVASLLDKHAGTTASKSFLDCDDAERLAAVRALIRSRDTLTGDIGEQVALMITALLSISMVGCFEGNSPEDQAVLFESMGWFDPRDPSGTFRIPCEGYVDSHMFPATSKKGVR